MIYFRRSTAKGIWWIWLGVPLRCAGHGIGAVYAFSLFGCIAAMFFAEFFLFLNTGPLNTVIVNVTRPGIRAMAFAVNIFFIHALGDAVSPSVLGSISDLHGLRAALMVTPGVILLAAFFCFACVRFIGEDSAKASPQA